MKWGHKWRDQLKTGYYYNLLSKGMISEDDLEPEISQFTFYLEAFKELSSCRQSGFGISPIPFTAIAEYFKLFQVSSDSFEDFHYIMRKMDDVLLELENKQKGVSTGGNSSSSNKN